MCTRRLRLFPSAALLREMLLALAALSGLADGAALQRLGLALALCMICDVTRSAMRKVCETMEKSELPTTTLDRRTGCRGDDSSGSDGCVCGGNVWCGYWSKSAGIDDLTWSTRPCLTMGMDTRVTAEVLHVEGPSRPPTRCISSLPMSFDLEESTRYAMSH